MILTKECYKEYLATTYAAWLGKNIGIRLGAPVEGWSSEKIEETYHGKEGYLVDYDIFASDDDSNGPLFFVRGLLDKKEITAQDIGNTFLAYIQEYLGFFWWGGVGVSTEHTAYENLKNGILPPQSGSKEQNGIAIAEQIGGQIFSDCWGYVAGGNPSLAKKLAIMASSVTHDENGIQGGIFVAVAIALAYEKNDIYEVIEEALTFLNPEMEYYKKVRIIMDYYQNHKENWKDCLKFIQENYGYDKYPGVCHIIPNLCVMIMGMLYGENDFSKTLTIINQSGWDTDCNCGNVGSIMGALVGIEGIDPSWITPINDVVNSSSCVGYLNIQSISASSKMFAKIAFKLADIEIEDQDQFDLPYATAGFRSNGTLKVENEILKVEADEVYNYAYYLGNDIYDSRYDPSFSPLAYPNDIICFDLSGDSIVQIFVEDCQGNKEYSEAFQSQGTISYTIAKGINKTIRRYGLKKISGKELNIHRFEIKNQSELELCFKNYPIDEYGPRYAGDSLFNLRGFVIHSGRYKVNDDGLLFEGDEHGLMTTLAPSYLEQAELSFTGESLMLVYDFVDYQNYKAVGLQQGKLVTLDKVDGIKMCKDLEEKTYTNGKYLFNLYTENGKMIMYFEGNAFTMEQSNRKGIVGICSESPFKTCINYLKIITKRDALN